MKFWRIYLSPSVNQSETSQLFLAFDLSLIVFQMVSTVLNIIMFEECRNQWSMSRPLLGLILLNEEVGT